MKTSFYTMTELQKLGFKSLGGEDILISRKVSIYEAENMIIADHVRIDDFCILSGTITLGEYIHISAYTALYGGNCGIVLKDFVTVSSRCAIYAITDDYSGEAMTNPMIPEQYRNVIGGTVILEKHTLVGSGCTILPKITIHEGVAIGSMSLINKSLDSWGIYAGIPCRRIKERSKNLLKIEQDFIRESQLY